MAGLDTPWFTGHKLLVAFTDPLHYLHGILTFLKVHILEQLKAKGRQAGMVWAYRAHKVVHTDYRYIA